MQRRTDIVISANSRWNLANFRTGLIDGLKRKGLVVTALAPPGDDHIPLACDTSEIAIDRSGVNPITDLALLWNYYRAFRRLRPATYLSFTIKPNIYGALAARWAGVASIPNVSGLGTAFIKDGLFAKFVGGLYRLAFRKSPIVFFQNEDDRALFVARNIVTSGQARLLPGSGVDIDHFAPEPCPSDGPPTFLLIARLLGDKGVREFAEAARMLRSELSGARFQILGPIDEGNRTAIKRAEIDRWVRDGIVEYVGASDDVRPYLREATAVVLPSYREGLPRTLLEGAAMARPLIATDVPGCREIAIDGVTGLLCEVRSAPSLAQAMRRMAALAPERREAMGRAGRTLIERKFSEQHVVQIYLDALQQLRGSREA